MNLISGKLPKQSASRGFTLVEVTLSLGVAGFCLLSLLGLLPIGLTSNQNSLDQTAAANISSAILGDLRCSQSLVSGTSPRFGISIPSAGSATVIATPQTIYLCANGSATGAVGSNPVASGTAPSQYRATMGFAPPASTATTAYHTATAVRILITWPALADSVPGSLPQNYTGSYEVDTSLNRN